jgi:cell fate regulator YaaT (PSP1 superfamily)
VPTLEFPNIGAVLDYEFLKGTIVSLDTVEDTCTVSLGGSTLAALLFYH